APGQRLERHRTDELLRPRGHRDVDVRAGLVEQPHDLGGLVRRDPSRDADDDARAAQRSRGVTGRAFAARSVAHRASLPGQPQTSRITRAKLPPRILAIRASEWPRAASAAPSTSKRFTMLRSGMNR